MARKKRHEEHENHERWLVSYADFITLLFAFFVVMYSVSSVSEGKYRVLADSMDAAFNESRRSLSPIQVGTVVRSPEVVAPTITESPVVIDMPRVPSNAVPEPGATEEPSGDGAGDGEAGPTGQEQGAALAEIDAVAEDVRQQMAPLVDDDLVEVRRGDNWLEIELKTSILFPSGSARLETGAVPVLVTLSEILKTFPNPVQVEGFTDNVPIRTVAFPSNWELSAARAASVVHLFMKNGVRAGRMVALGYGEYHPVADNGTPEGRSQNRRVVIVIPAERDGRRQIELRRADRDEGAEPGTPVTMASP